MSEDNRNPVPKFQSGQFVNLTKGNSQNNDGIVQISREPKWGEKSKQYWYGINYLKPNRKLNEMGRSGGSSFSWPESDFTEVIDPIDLLIIAKYEREKKRRETMQSISVLESEINKIHFTLDLLNPITEKDETEDET